MKNKRVVISGGGTGGHLFPALVLGRKLHEKDSEISVTFVGSRRAGEISIMARENVRFVPMRIEGLKGRGWRSLRGLVLLPGAFLKALVLLVRIRPALIVGVGGYSSGPVVLLAAWLRRPTVILEQNVRPGFTNRRLLRWVDKAVAAFDASLPYFQGKGVALGNPVREEFYAVPPKASGKRLALLVFGGSQGSRVLNHAIVDALPLLKSDKDRLDMVHQTGPAEVDWVKSQYRQNGFGDAVVAPFFDDMAGRFGGADLVIGRAGATTCAELIAARKPSILVPFAAAAEAHQAKNAEVLESAGGADVLPEGGDLAGRIAERIQYLLSHRERLAAMSRGLENLRKDDAAGKIAGLCLKLMGTRN
jgi:UDP-N-acetylglucosamine--N-acetylmuramyl-(pentapeptide) pyrophosphoryl-undecaprenol N-acetylglucosamine transferase